MMHVLGPVKVSIGEGMVAKENHSEKDTQCIQTSWAIGGPGQWLN